MYCESTVSALKRGRCGRDRMIVGITTTCAISAFHHKVVSSNLTQAIQHYVIKFASDLWQVRGILCALRFTPPIKLTPLKFVESGVKHQTQ